MILLVTWSSSATSTSGRRSSRAGRGRAPTALSPPLTFAFAPCASCVTAAALRLLDSPEAATAIASAGGQADLSRISGDSGFDEVGAGRRLTDLPRALHHPRRAAPAQPCLPAFRQRVHMQSAVQ